MNMKWTKLESFPKYEITRAGFVRTAVKTQNLKKHTVLALTDNGTKHLQVRLHKDHKKFRYLIHQLVASIFLPNPLNKPIVHHRDFDPKNNAAKNLQWLTKEEHLAIHGLVGVPRKLTASKVLEIRTSSDSPKVLAERYGIDRSMISHIRHLRYWRHVEAAPAPEQVFKALDGMAA